tara:strand:- start:109 stop:513 length:405 start_codon:yes stop_codon:yes gene_type:complete
LLKILKEINNIYNYKKKNKKMPNFELLNKLIKLYKEKHDLMCEEFKQMMDEESNILVYEYHDSRYKYYKKSMEKIREKGAKIEMEILYDCLHIPPKQLKYKHKYILINDDEMEMVERYVYDEHDTGNFEYYHMN